jgi:hypothetical protein
MLCKKKGETHVEYELSIGLACSTRCATKQPGARLRIDDYLSACAVGYSPILGILLDNALFVKRSNCNSVINDQHVLPPPAVELPAKDLLSGAKDFDELSRVVEPTIGDRDHNLAAHDLPLEAPSFLPSLGGKPVLSSPKEGRRRGSSS